jgi:hypothetical protein
VHKKIISAIKSVQFVRVRISYIIQRRLWCHIIILNVHALTEDKIGDVKDSFYEKLERVFSKFPKYHTESLSGDFNAKVGRKNIFRQTIEIKVLHKISNDNVVRLVNFVTANNFTVNDRVSVITK